MTWILGEFLLFILTRDPHIYGCRITSLLFAVFFYIAIWYIFLFF
jgi:hypothetical protein